jgi:hypothetical protein
MGEVYGGNEDKIQTQLVNLLRNHFTLCFSAKTHTILTQNIIEDI